MKALLQRVTHARLTIENKTHAAIGAGLVVLVGIGHHDTDNDARTLAAKITGMRVFANDEGKFDKTVRDISGEILVVSQFTLYADCSRGRRPDFTAAARPEKAVPLYERFVQELAGHGIPVKTGIFGADMLVDLHNDGPVTIMIESEGARA